MAEILKEWLTDRLQRPVKWEANDFGQLMKNGYIIASVLKSYHIINEEKYFLIRDSILPSDIMNNWIYLSEWLHDLDIVLSVNDINNVKEGKGSTLLRLFYQLFLHLDKKDRTDFIKSERKMVSTLVDKMENRFTVNKVPEEPEPSVDDLSRPLYNERHFIEWQKKKSAQVKETYDFIRHKYSKTLAKIADSKTPCGGRDPPTTPTAEKRPSKVNREMDMFATRYPCHYQNYTYEQLLELEEKYSERKKSLVDSEWAQEYMDNLNTRIHKKSDSLEFQKQLMNTLSSNIWDMSVAEEETVLDAQLVKKVMKLSQFEKQMCTQIMETKQQTRNLIRNRIKAEKEFTDQRDQQFAQFLDNIKEQLHLDAVEIDFEKRRQNLLHEKLYAEKMKRKRQHYREICYDTMLSIVDYATKYANFKRLMGDDDIPQHYIHEWKNLFFKFQPMFDLLEPLDDLLKDDNMEEEVLPEVEEIIRLELNRQEALNEIEFEEYHNYWYPWTLETLIPNFEPDSEERRYEYLGNRILGHVVYTLLEVKYPMAPPIAPADLPPYTSKAIISGLPDKSITVPMQILLNNNKILVVRLECAINYCLKQFKTEMIGCTDIELNFDKFMAATTDDESKEFVKSLKEADDALSKSTDNMSGLLLPLPANSKQTQTPKALPEIEIKLSNAAELGKYAYESLSFGDSLTDHLLSASIVEYLKDQGDINGFVIINYPNTYREAAIIEETFSSREPPPEQTLEDRDDIYLEESIIKHRKKEKDQYKDIRGSKLVKNPKRKNVDRPFESYFTCFIKMKESEDILQEIVIWDLTPENSLLIDRLYASLGLNYSMYYEVIEKELLVQICKYIIGDLSLPLKSTDALFGESVLSSLDFPTTEAKRIKSKIVKPEVLMTTGKSKDRFPKAQASKSSAVNTLEIKAATDSVDDMPDEPITVMEHATPEESELKSLESVDEMKILAGDEEWEYGELPVPELLGTALATCWEEIEKAYIHDIQQLLFAKRLQMNCLVPYTRFIKDKMEQIITLPSYKQDHVFRFQKEYNDFEDDWRDVNLAKNEWHCRVKELQSTLNNICDERKLVAEQQRQALICDNWAMEELTTMANTYISCMQAELNRFFLTIQTLHDFYNTLIKRHPPMDRVTSSKELMKIAREPEEIPGNKKLAEDKVFRQLKASYRELQLKNIEIDFSNNPFNMILENNVKLAQKFIKDSNDYYKNLISKEYVEVAKLAIPVKKKDQDNMSTEESISPEEIYKMAALSCIEEWAMAVNGEMYRANLRMLVLQHKCIEDMTLFNKVIYQAFMKIQGDIDQYYTNEIEAVDRLCKYVQIAIESGKKIPETLILEHDAFIIDPNLLQFVEPEPPGPDDMREVVGDMDFKLSQLARIRTQLKIVAPTGLALLPAFIYVFQDFICFGKESCKGPIFPEYWSPIEPDHVKKLVYYIFGETAYIDWRDFLIYCLNLRFPTLEELLDMRHRFRCDDPDSTELIHRDDFINEPLWFENDLDPEDKHAQLRKNLIKHFLFELFETSEDLMNYPALLLALCKSEKPLEGFAMALSMSVGKRICYLFEECEDIVCHMVKLKHYKDESLACALKCTLEFLETMLDQVIQTCEGTTVEAYKEGHKKRGKGKGKKSLESQSARMPKKSFSSNVKMRHSSSDVKSSRASFICPPCKTDSIEDVPTEKETIEEEEKRIEPVADPNVMYSVAQSVIWNILEICLPWHFVLVPEVRETPYVNLVRSILDNLKTNHSEDEIYVSMFLTNPDICQLLHKVKKFTAINLPYQIRRACY